MISNHVPSGCGPEVKVPLVLAVVVLLDDELRSVAALEALGPPRGSPVRGLVILAVGAVCWRSASGVSVLFTFGRPKRAKEP